MAPRETEDNVYAKFWGDKQRALWDVMVFSGVVNCSASNGINRCCTHSLSGCFLSSLQSHLPKTAFSQLYGLCLGSART